MAASDYARYLRWVDANRERRRKTWRAYWHRRATEIAARRQSKRTAIFARDGHRCHYCGAVHMPENLTLDHKVPKVDDGTNDPENLVTACKLCNNAKGRMSYSMFMAIKYPDVEPEWVVEC